MVGLDGRGQDLIGTGVPATMKPKVLVTVKNPNRIVATELEVRATRTVEKTLEETVLMEARPIDLVDGATKQQKLDRKLLMTMWSKDYLEFRQKRKAEMMGLTELPKRNKGKRDG